MKNKVTEKQKKQMKDLFKEGLKFRVIARKVGLAHTTVIYHLVPAIREEKIKKQSEYFRNLPQEKKQEIYRRRRGYLNEWLKKKYREDKEFRKKRLEYSKERYKKLKGVEE